MLVLFPRPVHQTPERFPEYAAMRPPETITGHARGQTKTEQVHAIGQPGNGHNLGDRFSVELVAWATMRARGCLRTAGCRTW